jgi:hypothetical protein
VVVKNSLVDLDYKQIGKPPKFHFFNSQHQINIDRHGLVAWYGYECCTQLCTQGVFLNIDCMTKFINKHTVYDQVIRRRESGYGDSDIAKLYGNSSTNRINVITSHNSKNYQIDGIELQLNPKTCKFRNSDGVLVTMKDYYRMRYKGKDGKPVCLIDDQPLLYVNQNKGEAAERIYLPTELCHVANLPKNFTKDESKMRDLQNYKIYDP